MRFFYFWLVAGALAACAAPSTSSFVTSSAATSVSYLALGDSYTIGEGASHADRWPVQLVALLRQQGVAVAEPDIIARTGWTTAELQEAIAASHNHRTDYGLVSLLIGVNNQYRGQSLNQYRIEFRALLATAQQYAGGRASRVVVLSIPDWGQTPFAADQDRAHIGQQINQFNAAARQECEQAGIAWVDITPFTRTINADATQVTADGLHYTGPQMHRWAETALPVVQSLLR